MVDCPSRSVRNFRGCSPRATIVLPKLFDGSLPKSALPRGVRLSSSDGIRVAAYLLLALVALAKCRAATGTDRRTLQFVGSVSLALGILLLLGLAGQVADAGRNVARGEGWYQERREVQAAFVMALLAGCVVALLGVGFALRSLSTRGRLLIGGVTLLVTYVAIHTVSLHQLDAVLNEPGYAGIRAGDWVEVLSCGAMVLVVVTTPSGWKATTGDK